ncbi:macro domain-containing protein [Haemophilus parahaemolyticus]
MFNLPSKFVLHTVGLIINKSIIENDRSLLADCYRSCLELAKKSGLKSVAFCCIITG